MSDRIVGTGVFRGYEFVTGISCTGCPFYVQAKGHLNGCKHIAECVRQTSDDLFGNWKRIKSSAEQPTAQPTGEPTVPGWYWAKEKKSTWKNIIELTPSEIKDKAFHQAALRYPFKAFTFYGPLPEPEGW